MIFAVVLPDIVFGMTSAEVQAVYCAVGEELKRGGKILDLKVDLSSVFDHDCPPVSCYRLAASSPMWVREVLVKPGEAARTGETLVICSTTPDERLDEQPRSPARISVIAILGQSDFWA